MLTINIIGCGKLGKTIGKLLVESQAAVLNGIVNSSLKSAENAAGYIGSGKAFAAIDELPSADIYFITTQDDVVEKIANHLLTTENLKPGAIVVHCSGALCDVLNKMKEKNCLIASIHPVKSFANPDRAVTTFTGTYCAVEGDDAALAILVPLFEKIGGKIFSVNKDKKIIYHAGNVIANNYLVTLHYQAMQCYLNAGINEEIAKDLASMLMQDAIDHLKFLPHDEALTGPIKRGDAKVISAHIAALSEIASLQNAKDIYLALGRGTLDFAEREDLGDVFNEELKTKSF